jgi:hypothetical protein
MRRECCISAPEIARFPEVYCDGPGPGGSLRAVANSSYFFQLLEFRRRHFPFAFRAASACRSRTCSTI